jgi:hypothetical protein
VGAETFFLPELLAAAAVFLPRESGECHPDIRSNCIFGSPEYNKNGVVSTMGSRINLRLGHFTVPPIINWQWCRSGGRARRMKMRCRGVCTPKKRVISSCRNVRCYKTFTVLLHGEILLDWTKTCRTVRDWEPRWFDLFLPTEPIGVHVR